MSTPTATDAEFILPCKLLRGPVLEDLMQKFGGSSRIWISKFGIGIDVTNSPVGRMPLRLAIFLLVFTGFGVIVGFFWSIRDEYRPVQGIELAEGMAVTISIGVIVGLLWAFRPTFSQRFRDGPKLWAWQRFDRIDVKDLVRNSIRIVARSDSGSREVTTIDVLVEVTSDQVIRLARCMPMWAGDRFEATEPRPSQSLQKIPTLAHRLGAAIRQAKQSDEP